MKAEKNSFIMYTDYLEHVLLLTKEQRGDLFTAVLCYAAGETLPELDGMSKMAFSFIKVRMDKDNESYLKTVEARREAGKRGGRPSKAIAIDEEAKKANGFSENQIEAKKADNDIDNVNDNEKDINTMCNANALFERLWKMYPNKKGKGQVSDTQKKRLLAIGETTLVKAIERYSLELQKDADWRKLQNGSTFFNSGYVDYLEENYQPAPIAPRKNQGNKFNNFDQREYDYDALEKQLLGNG